MTYQERDALCRKAMEFDCPNFRHGFYAALAATHGRTRMEGIRQMVNHRKAGGTDLPEVFRTFREATKAMATAIRGLFRVA